MTSSIQKIRKAVFPVAGLGTRLLPATKVLAKEMLTIVDRPLIQMAVEEAQEAGIEEFIFVTNVGKEMVAQHFSSQTQLIESLEKRQKQAELDKVNQSTLQLGALKTVLQGAPLGLGHAVWCAKDLVGDEPFAVILPDDTVRNSVGCLKQMVGFYNEHGKNVIATCQVDWADTSKYGILDLHPSINGAISIKNLVEKPSTETAPSNMAIFGRYILQPSIFSYLDKKMIGAGGEIQLTDAMAQLLKDEPIFGFQFEGERLDCGNEVGFVKAQIAYALDKGNIAPEILNYMIEKLRQHYNVRDAKDLPFFKAA